MNPVLLQTLERDPEAENLRVEIERAARAAGALPRGHERTVPDLVTGTGVQEVRTASGRYEIHASCIGAELTTHDRAIVVVVESKGAAFPGPEDLRARYGLTPRESEVALLLARGLSDKKIAGELVISWHTVRRHTERVLRKLGVESRAEVAANLLGG